MSEDKKHKPSFKKLQDAKNKGQIVNSKEFITWLILLSVIISIIILKGYIYTNLINIFNSGLIIERSDLFVLNNNLNNSLNNELDKNLPIIFKFNIIKSALLIILPIILIVNLITIGGHLLISGIVIKNIEFSLNKLNPITGIKRIFSINTIFELIKSILKISLLFIVSFFIIKHNILDIINLAKLNNKLVIIYSINYIINFSLYLILSLTLIVIIDVPFQIYQHYKKLMMSDFELKQEHKEHDGNPLIKSKIKSMQQQLATRRMLEAIPSANVIINNPTHIAVALKYDPLINSAPIVVAKGSNMVAQNIRKIAKKHGVMQVYSRQLARAIFYSTNCNQPVAPDLYLAVAKVLAYIHHVDKLAQDNINLEDIEIPPHLVR